MKTKTNDDKGTYKSKSNHKTRNLEIKTQFVFQIKIPMIFFNNIWYMNMKLSKVQNK
jgi:hypothetical protein